MHGGKKKDNWGLVQTWGTAQSGCCWRPVSQLCIPPLGSWLQLPPTSPLHNTRGTSIAQPSCKAAASERGHHASGSPAWCDTVQRSVWWPCWQQIFPPSSSYGDELPVAWENRSATARHGLTLNCWLMENYRQIMDRIAAFQYLKGPTKKLERDFWQGQVVIGQGLMALNWKRGDLN